MPEGHTIHRLARDLNADLSGHRVEASSPQGRFEDAGAIDGQRLTRAEANGKHLFLVFGRRVVHIHLGLFGRFYRRRSPAPAPRDTTRLRLVGPSFTYDLVGPTRCELLAPSALRALRARLGADPLAAEADIETAWSVFSKTSRSVGAVLLDQRVLSGIGNVYRAEILFLLGIHPLTPASALDRATFDRMWSMTRELLARGVAAKRIITVAHAPGTRVRRGEALHVYRRRFCRVCGGPVRWSTVGNRPMYACERCQPPYREPAPPLQRRQLPAARALPERAAEPATPKRRKPGKTRAEPPAAPSTRRRPTTTRTRS